ncbi:hypothetical protein Pr1d_34770 [Bythopirellula goksoeyrii]|uniref:Carboxypeptidase regulatory-like domain-containing protein n=2 Tax=Bythopirellula goksoeyrii TaxID=1400387 RepID=A0A5B9QB66_9BACT|nr:hypothetical protein Pr1d_34770 [Bythopirellula goksoeyrii]
MLSPFVQAEGIPLRTLDISLQTGGVLSGKVVTAAGNVQPGLPVVVRAGGEELATTKTDPSGNFQVAGLKGGVVEVAAAGTQGNCRLWAPGTAPPAAQPGLLVVSQDQVVRGQNCGSRVGCGTGVFGGQGGGVLGFMLDHPLVTAGVIGTAIAIPLALDDNDSPATP